MGIPTSHPQMMALLFLQLTNECDLRELAIPNRSRIPFVRRGVAKSEAW